MTPSAIQYQTIPECKNLRESCPARTGVRMAMKFAGLIVLALAGTWGVALMAYDKATQTETEFNSHASAQEERDVWMKAAVEGIQETLDKMHPREGE